MINRKVSMLNAQQGPRLKDDVPAAVATNPVRRIRDRHDGRAPDIHRKQS